MTHNTFLTPHGPHPASAEYSWNLHKSKLKRLYLGRGRYALDSKPVGEIMKIMEKDHSFKAS